MEIKADITLKRGSGFELNAQLTIPSSGITALYGPSGSGKSTLLRLLAGLERGKSSDNIRICYGSTILQDRDCFVEPHNRSVGFVFQQHQLFPHLDVAANLEFAIKRRRSEYTISMEQVCAWLDIAHLINKPVNQLSGGEAQRVAIARVLLNSPKYILMDEPLGSVDVQGRKHILPHLEELHGKLKIPIVYVTHALDEMTYLADRVYMLKMGRIEAQGTIFELSTRLDLSISDEESSAAVIWCKVESYDKQYGLTSLSFEGQNLLVADSKLTLNRQIRVRIPARDVSISIALNDQTSILNSIKCTIEAISKDDNSRALLKLTTGRQHLLARITLKSMDRLGLTIGQEVFAQIKSVVLLTEYYDH